MCIFFAHSLAYSFFIGMYFVAFAGIITSLVYFIDYSSKVGHPIMCIDNNNRNHYCNLCSFFRAGIQFCLLRFLWLIFIKNLNHLGLQMLFKHLLRIFRNCRPSRNFTGNATFCECVLVRKLASSERFFKYLGRVFWI